MVTPREARRRAAALLERSGILLTPRELHRMEVADYGLGRLATVGLQIHVYVNTPRYCAKELVLLPGQTCPEHRHPPIGRGNPGKQETFRCRWGEVYLHVPGRGPRRPKARAPGEWFTAAREEVLRPGEQFTVEPDTLHWFQAGPRGAVVSEFSSRSVDARDLFTDPAIRRFPRGRPPGAA
jgi:D-lyxose ketol-isomerase